MQIMQIKVTVNTPPVVVIAANAVIPLLFLYDSKVHISLENCGLRPLVTGFFLNVRLGCERCEQSPIHLAIKIKIYK